MLLEIRVASLIILYLYDVLFLGEEFDLKFVISGEECVASVMPRQLRLCAHDTVVLDTIIHSTFSHHIFFTSFWTGNLNLKG